MMVRFVQDGSGVEELVVSASELGVVEECADETGSSALESQACASMQLVGIVLDYGKKSVLPRVMMRTAMDVEMLSLEFGSECCQEFGN